MDYLNYFVGIRHQAPACVLSMLLSPVPRRIIVPHDNVPGYEATCYCNYRHQDSATTLCLFFIHMELINTRFSIHCILNSYFALMAMTFSHV